MMSIAAEARSAGGRPGVRAVILDWAGTTVDHGSRAPVAAIRRGFAAHGVTLTEEEARGPMGMAKRDHIASLLADPSVADRWMAVTGDRPGPAVLDLLYREFQEIQVEEIARHAGLIDGTLAACASLRAAGIRIGSTTGYFRTAALAAAAHAAAAGFVPEVIVAADEVPAGRPEPWMLLRAMEQLRVFPPWQVVKVGDTLADIGEGRNAGAWAIGISETGNEIGLDAEALAALPTEERAGREAAARARLADAGAHVVIPSIAALPAAVRALGDRIRAGERPG